MKNLCMAIVSLGLTVACTATSTDTPEAPVTPPVVETETAPAAAPETRASDTVLELAEAAPEANAETQTTNTEPETEQEVPVIAEPKPLVIEVDWASVPEGAAWTDFTANAIDELGSGLIASSPSDVSSFCPNYEILDDETKRAFWVSLISAMARPESNFNPAVSFNEYDNCKYPGCKDDFTTQDGRKVVSRGLLQMSQESANGYKRFGCEIAIEDEETLHDPATNLRCGVVILARWVSADGQIAKETSPYRGGARYWSVLRRPGKIAGIQNFTANTSYCSAD